MDTYTARQSGTVGHEILADGEIIAWTVDGYWAAVIVAMLNGAKGYSRKLPHIASDSGNAPGPGNDPGGDVGEDTEATARAAISHCASPTKFGG